MSVIVRQVDKRFGQQSVFQQFSCTFETGKISALVGPSGCGKTTLLRMIAGLERCDSGTIKGVPDRISFVFQEDRLLSWLTAYENIGFVLKDIYNDKEAYQIIDDLLIKLGLMRHQHKYPSELSGGMRRRIALGRAFAYPAPLILMDEPFSGLDKETKHQIAETFFEWSRQEGRTLIMVTHDHDIMQKADKVIALDRV